MADQDRNITTDEELIDEDKATTTDATADATENAESAVNEVTQESEGAADSAETEDDAENSDPKHAAPKASKKSRGGLFGKKKNVEPVEESEAAREAAKLLAEGLNEDNLNPNMKRIVKKQAEETRRVEKSIENTKSNPAWLVPLFCFFLLLGLAWVVVYYLSGSYPIPNIGAWNLAIGFAIMFLGFIMSMWWR